jgi:hypothetical protein
VDMCRQDYSNVPDGMPVQHKLVACVPILVLFPLSPEPSSSRILHSRRSFFESSSNVRSIIWLRFFWSPSSVPPELMQAHIMQSGPRREALSRPIPCVSGKSGSQQLPPQLSLITVERAPGSAFGQEGRRSLEATGVEL